MILAKISEHEGEHISIEQIFEKRQVMLRFMLRAWFNTDKKCTMVENCMAWLLENYKCNASEYTAIKNCRRYSDHIRDSGYYHTTGCFDWIMIKSCTICDVDEDEIQLISKRIKSIWFLTDRKYIMALFALVPIISRFPYDVHDYLCDQFHCVISHSQDLGRVLYKIGRVPMHQLEYARNMFPKYIISHLQHAEIGSIKAAKFCIDYLNIDTQLLSMLDNALISSYITTRVQHSDDDIKVFKFILNNMILTDEQILYIVGATLCNEFILDFFITEYNIQKSSVDLCISQINDILLCKRKLPTVLGPSYFNGISKCYISNNILIKNFESRYYAALKIAIEIIKTTYCKKTCNQEWEEELVEEQEEEIFYLYGNDMNNQSDEDQSIAYISSDDTDNEESFEWEEELAFYRRHYQSEQLQRMY